MPGSPSNGTERPRSGSGGPPEGHPSAEQLWSAIEFSRQFPELTLYLAADVKARNMAAKKQLQPLELPEEILEFPPLVAPDPRELRTAHPLPKKQEQPARFSEELELFASGQLSQQPDPKPAPPSPEAPGKKSFWRSLLSFTFLFALL